MSDHDAAPDPIDDAYVQAEALLSDEEARAARRARVLAAVAREAAAPAPTVRGPAWRRGRWLAAASVAGLGVLIATQIYTPPRRQTQTTPVAPMAAPGAISALPEQPVPAQSTAPPAPGLAAAPRAEAPAAPRDMAQPPPPPAQPPPAPVAIAPEPQAFPAPPPPPPPPPSPTAVVTAERRESADAAAAQNATRSAEKATPGPGFAGAPAAAMARPDSSADLSSDQASRLRAAAAAGRTMTVDALLAQGAPIDAADPDGNTALMDAIKADHTAAAASLRRHGASLDRRNDAGESARDMATAKGDAALDKALGLSP
jgi:type IV secretory pathway VirB10-like protein